MSEDIPFEIHEEIISDLTPVTVGTDHSTVGSFSAFIIIGHMTGALEEYDIPDLDYSQHRRDNTTITTPTQLYKNTTCDHNLCPICREDFTDNDEVVILDCKHVFHGDCIKEWGHYKGNCPICRTDVEKENPE
jgi:hypothetical protein